jgi:membrane protease subunit HflK
MGVILRFGKYVRTSEPGLHFKLPLGIETLMRVPVQRQLKLEFGFRTAKPGIQSEYTSDAGTRAESVMLTGDLNVVVTEWIVQYKIKDPYKFLFKMREATTTFRGMTEAVVRRIIGDNSVDEVITVGRARIANEAKESLQRLCDAYEIGIDVNQLIFQDVNPPDPVKPSFNDVRPPGRRKIRPGQYNQDHKATGGRTRCSRRRGCHGAHLLPWERTVRRSIRCVKYAVTRKRLYLEP